MIYKEEENTGQTNISKKYIYKKIQKIGKVKKLKEFKNKMTEKGVKNNNLFLKDTLI